MAFLTGLTPLTINTRVAISTRVAHSALLARCTRIPRLSDLNISRWSRWTLNSYYSRVSRSSWRARISDITIFAFVPGLTYIASVALFSVTLKVDFMTT